MQTNILTIHHQKMQVLELIYDMLSEMNLTFPSEIEYNYLMCNQNEA